MFLDDIVSAMYYLLQCKKTPTHKTRISPNMLAEEQHKPQMLIKHRP